MLMQLDNIVQQAIDQNMYQTPIFLIKKYIINYN